MYIDRNCVVYVLTFPKNGAKVRHFYEVDIKKDT